MSLEAASGNLLRVEDLGVKFTLPDEEILAVRGVSFNLDKGKTLGLVGESGCGKSVTAFSILNLVSKPGFIHSGKILYNGNDILKMSEEELMAVRGREIAMIFQEPMTSLNPVFTIGRQISESIELHLKMKGRDSRNRSIELLSQVGIPNPEKRIDSYPHEFSGGMRQRVMIAMALAASPKILIADEPTTALDVTIQAQILDLLMRIQEENNMSMLLITHNLGIVANIADDIAIMYAGEIIETGPVGVIFSDPKHPYTRGLFDSVPRIGGKGERLVTILGTVPTITADIAGCPFHPRCPIGIDECLEAKIEMRGSANHQVRCIKA